MRLRFIRHTAVRASALLLLLAPLGGGVGCDQDPAGEPPVDPKGVCPTEWRAYPYAPEGTDIVFPRDEGAHYPLDHEISMEWWYTIYHLTTPGGREFSIMATFFMPQLDIAFRPFNITDVREGKMWDTSLWGTLEPGTDYLDMRWVADDPALPPSTFTTRRYANGDLVPFGYEQHLVYLDPADPGRSQSLHLRIDSTKSPYIVGGDGYVTIGDAGDSYYYSLTHLEVSGELEINGEVFDVEGIGWLDHQWGPFMLHPLVISPMSYEWMALHLDNGDEYMVSTLFDRQNRAYAAEGFGSIGWKRADCTQGIALSYTIERLAYWRHPVRGQVYSHRWHIVDDTTGLDVLLEPVIEDQTVQFFNTFFYEGRSRITGTQDGVPVTGLAFAELVHHYEAPELVITAPSQGTAAPASAPVEVAWTVQNPDDGLPLIFSVTAEDATTTADVCTIALGEGQDPEQRGAFHCSGALSGLAGPTTLRVHAASIDGLLTGDASQVIEATP